MINNELERLFNFLLHFRCHKSDFDVSPTGLKTQRHHCPAKYVEPDVKMFKGILVKEGKMSLTQTKMRLKCSK